MNRLFDLSGKIALVTGGSRGIGRAISLALAAHGASVAINYASNVAAAEETAKEIGEGRAVTLAGDVSDPATAAALIEGTVAAFGRIDILVNNAGVTADDLILRMSEEAWDRVVDTNLKGAFAVSKAALRPMIRQRWGRIVSVSSVAGMVGNAGQANYSAAKAGIQGLTKTLAIELGRFGVRANCVAPGFIATAMTQQTAERIGMSFEDFQAAAAKQIPLQRVGQPEDVAGVIAFLCSDDAAYVTGQVIYVSGGP